MASVISRLSKIFSLAPEVTGYTAWEQGEELGRGTTGIVYRVTNKHTGMKAAMKVVDSRCNMKPEEWQQLRDRTAREANILKLLDHPSIVKIYDFFERENKWHLVMELVTGGELLDRVQDHPDGKIPEAQAKIWFRQIVSAVQYCHEHLVVHRDLKLENVLIDEHGNVKITDFGFANFIVDHDSFLKTFCGSPMYAAPEIFIGVKYKGPPLDVWSMGVLLFTMLAGAFPWKSKTADYNLMREVVSGRFALAAHMSEGAKALIKSMLVVNPDERPAPELIPQNEWLNDGKAPAKAKPALKIASVEALDVEILQQLEELGFDREVAVQELLEHSTNLVKAAYDLLLAKKEAASSSSSSSSGASASSSQSPTQQRHHHHHQQQHQSSSSSQEGGEEGCAAAACSMTEDGAHHHRSRGSKSSKSGKSGKSSKSGKSKSGKERKSRAVAEKV